MIYETLSSSSSLLFFEVFLRNKHKFSTVGKLKIKIYLPDFNDDDF